MHSSPFPPTTLKFRCTKEDASKAVRWMAPGQTLCPVHWDTANDRFWCRRPCLLSDISKFGECQCRFSKYRFSVEIENLEKFSRGRQCQRVNPKSLGPVYSVCRSANKYRFRESALFCAGALTIENRIEQNIQTLWQRLLRWRLTLSNKSIVWVTRGLHSGYEWFSSFPWFRLFLLIQHSTPCL